MKKVSHGKLKTDKTVDMPCKICSKIVHNLSINVTAVTCSKCVQESLRSTLIK